MSANHSKVGLLGDSPDRVYTHKLDQFNRFAEAELKQAIHKLKIKPRSKILDLGSGTGLISYWLAQAAKDAQVVGLDLSTAHLQFAQKQTEKELPHFIQGDMDQLMFKRDSFDLIWSSNAMNHLHHPVQSIKVALKYLKSGGQLVLGQSAFLADMFFAWDARLEQEVMLACRQYYRDKYGLGAADTSHVRNLYGWLYQVGLSDIQVETIIIERTAPLTPRDEQYFLQTVFKGYWGHRVAPYLSQEDWQTLQRLCDPSDAAYCLHRPDFHHIQTFTLVKGTKA